ncbi:MAG: hypothetical protein Q7S17_05145 [Xanthobacteraceae bacterium]|nr:hypothetical protein [Xanthobacteraceae bacterium]
MAKRKDEDTEPKGEAPEQKTIVLLSSKTMTALLKQDDNYKDKIDGIVGELRETIGNAVEKKHLDKAAYALLKKFHRIKSNEELANLWDTLQAYMDMTGVMKRIESVPSLPLDGKNNEAEAEDKNSNVTRLPRVVTETAGAAQG